MHEAYSHELIAAGFWLGSEELPQAEFYSYSMPPPPVSPMRRSDPNPLSGSPHGANSSCRTRRCDRVGSRRHTHELPREHVRRFRGPRQMGPGAPRGASTLQLRHRALTVYRWIVFLHIASVLGLLFGPSRHGRVPSEGGAQRRTHPGAARGVRGRQHAAVGLLRDHARDGDPARFMGSFWEASGSGRRSSSSSRSPWS